MSNLSILRTYAQKPPSEFPSSVLFTHTERTLTIYDAYPKSTFHFLILPRVQSESEITLKDLHSLKTLLKCDKSHAKEVIDALAKDAEDVKKEIESEMVKRYGFKWQVVGAIVAALVFSSTFRPIWTGFHASPSMHHLHLHVLSADLCSEKLKHKKHYNSFHPKLGFFLHLEDVLGWFEAEPSYFTQMAKLDEKKYESLLKEGLTCFHCDKEMKNIPTLKEHLQSEWDAQASKAKAREERKRKAEERKKDTDSDDVETATDEHQDKKQKS
ncbi:aprataxin-like protein [Paramarasmius palmivorus]|uniref:Aprataxin-like protein n=1 Tax=Paramarasmius palmivorus TaxID=297713 RepID=A0AAW0CXS1_9AGAR